MQRTIRLPLNPTPEQVAILLETSRQFTQAFNFVCATGWDADEKNGVALHHLTYRHLKGLLPDLVSDLHIQARMKATEAVRSAFTLRKQGRKVSCPHSAGCPPRYNVHTFKMDWELGTARLSTTSGRIEVGFAIPEVFAWAKDGKVCTADLVHRKGRCWLHVVIETPSPIVEPNHTVVGVDLGVNRPAVTSDRRFLGKRSWKNVEARLFRQKRQCQAKRPQSFSFA